MKKLKIIDGKKKITQRRASRKLFQPNKSYIAKVLASEIEDPPLQIRREILRELGPAVSLKLNKYSLSGSNWRKLN